MGFVPFNNVIKLEGIYTWDSQRVENVHYYLVDETPSVDTCTALAASYKGWFDTVLDTMVSNQVQLVLIRCTIMETESSPGIEYATGLPLPGLSTDASMPNSVTVAIKWSTGLRGRSFRGRTYFIGLTEAQVTGNVITGSTLSALVTRFGDLMALDTNVGPAVLCVASRVHNGVERVTGVATPIIDLSVDATIDSQRRRLPGRGR